MFIAGLGSAAPAQRYTQNQCWDTLVGSSRFDRLAPRSRAILRKVLNGDNGIESRHLALANLNEAFDISPDVLHKRFVTHAPALAVQAAERALAASGAAASDIGALLISTCTGYLCPGLTSYVAERLALRPNTLGLDLVGQGCAASIPNLRTAESLLAADRCEVALSICVEVCSAAFYLDDDPGVLISACLFGDGAGAAVLTRERLPRRRAIEWQSALSFVSPAQRDLLRFEQTGGLLRNILSPAVPELAAEHAASMLAANLAASGVAREEIRGWVIHPGGRDVLKTLGGRLGLNDADLRWSASVLREYGNVSSSSLYFVLDAALHDSAPAGYWWASSFGAGFSCHGALLKVD